MGCEAGISVADDFMWKSIPAVHVTEVQVGNLWSGDRRVTGEEDGHSRASVVDNGQDGVIVIAFR